MATVSVESVFQVRGVTKVYQMGDVQVHALRGVDLDLFPGEFIASKKDSIIHLDMQI